jgi:hypothetical protein
MWVAALRSGYYTQGMGKLRRDDDTFCCFGVLCEIAVRFKIIPPPVLDMTCYRYECNSFSYPPVAVLGWAEMDPTFRFSAKELRAVHPEIVAVHDRPVDLAELNDVGVSFSIIADIIERYGAEL